MAVIGRENPVCRLSLHLMGPFEARVHGALIPRLRTRKGGWLLALLALRAGSPVSRLATEGAAPIAWRVWQREPAAWAVGEAADLETDIAEAGEDA